MYGHNPGHRVSSLYYTKYYRSLYYGLLLHGMIEQAVTLYPGYICRIKTNDPNTSFFVVSMACCMAVSTGLEVLIGNFSIRILSLSLLHVTDSRNSLCKRNACH